MNLNLSEEQRLLQDSVARYVAREHDFAQYRRIADGDAEAGHAVWRSMAELGWLGLPLPEADGGSGGGPMDIAIVMEGLGSALVLAPYLSTAVLGADLIARLATPAQRERWLPALAKGALRIALAASGAIAADGRRGLDIRATRGHGRGWRLDGVVRGVVDAPDAGLWLVPARIDDDAAGPADAIAVFTVTPRAPGLAATAFGRVDGRRAADLAFDGVTLTDGDRLGASDAEPGDARVALEAALDAATAAACADAIGCLTVLVDRTVAYAKTRIQFDQPLAAHQALRHRMVDMALHREEARAIALCAALRLDGDPGARARMVSGAKIRVGRAARAIAEGAIQIHGAMGVTDELAIGAYAKRLLAFEMTHGTAAEHQRRIVALRRAAGGLRPFD
ncbi:acyl-CoA dehydrogenase family protein [Verticiella sediminum]|nr:acyl-CoA dehydrogenase family protein [Verticiella sediminum]